jgi:uncharacterized protein
MSPPRSQTDEEVVQSVVAWLEHAVIGLNLCPFAHEVHATKRIRYVVTRAANESELLEVLRTELRTLAESDPAVVETTLLIHPDALRDFDDFNQFLDTAEGALTRFGYDGVLQIASFHPDYRFAGVPPDDITNATNRAPYPILHLLRESSIERALDLVPDTSKIIDANLKTMRDLGTDGWDRLRAKWRIDRADSST